MKKKKKKKNFFVWKNNNSNFFVTVGNLFITLASSKVTRSVGINSPTLTPE